MGFNSGFKGLNKRAGSYSDNFHDIHKSFSID